MPSGPAPVRLALGPASDTVHACPRCERPMQHLHLPGRGSAPVVVDHCAPCRLVWFDALESVQLSGPGWITLLREMQAAPHEPVAATGLPACPLCRRPLAVVHNRTRYGRFAVHECPQRHGHLQDYTGLLAERGLVRPLLRPERRALAEERRALECLHCGAPGDGQAEHCAWCGSLLLMIDLPRLATALRARPGDPLPPPEGQPLRWSCRGCGQALDPVRRTDCAACGHVVVVPSLLDIVPLLDLVAAEYAAAAARATPRPPARRPRRPHTWRDTGLGMLARYTGWRERHGQADGLLRWVLLGLLLGLLLST